MGKPDTRRLDKAIQQTDRKLTAVRSREMWPLDGRERRAVLSAGLRLLPRPGQQPRPRGTDPGHRVAVGRDPADHGTRRPADRAAAHRARGRHRKGREEVLRLVVTLPAGPTTGPATAPHLPFQLRPDPGQSGVLLS